VTEDELLLLPRDQCNRILGVTGVARAKLFSSWKKFDEKVN
jgi:hypothetical protein